MNRSMLDILACPIDKHSPLQLHECKAKGDIVIDGVLTCSKCSRFFPIIEEIPIMLPDDLRDKKQESDFMEKYRGSIPESVRNNPKPWN